VHGLVRNWSRVESRVVTPRQSVDEDGLDSIDVRHSGRIGRLGHRAAIARLNAPRLSEARRFCLNVLLSSHIVTSPAAWLIDRAQRTPFVQYLHAREMAERPHLTRFALSRASAAVAVSRFTQDLARSYGAEPSRLHRIPPGVDMPRTALRERARRPTVVTVSRLESRYKGHDAMIRALPGIRERVPDVLWLVLGDGPLRSEFQQSIHEVGLDAHVRFLGSVTDHERDACLDQAHVFAMPSRVVERKKESFGIVYLEAASHGLPVVAGNVGGALDAVIDGETGKLVEPTDYVSLADSISELLLDKHRAETLGRAGEGRAREFAWPRIARRVEDLLMEVAKR